MKEIKYTGDGKTKETAIYFLNARHAQDENMFESEYLEAHQIKFTPLDDETSEFHGSCEPDIRHEEIFEPVESPTEGILYVRYFTTEGDLWFKFDRGDIEDTGEYLKWLEENGL
ncbi:MAG: hypothetical protein ACLFP1_08305 [Candidatus Goldiibacteriota bacterium]